MKKPLYPVSDHAVLCYLERVEGMDIEATRREIGRKVQIAAEHPGVCGVIVGGHRYRIADGVVTTVIHAAQPNLHTGRQRRVEDDE